MNSAILSEACSSGEWLDQVLTSLQRNLQLWACLLCLASPCPNPYVSPHAWTKSSTKTSPFSLSLLFFTVLLTLANRSVGCTSSWVFAASKRKDLCFLISSSGHPCWAGDTKASPLLSLLSIHLQPHCLSTAAHTYSCTCVFRGSPVQGTGRKVWEVLNPVSQSCGAVFIPNATLYYVSSVIQDCMPPSRALQRGCDSPFVTLHFPAERKKTSLAEAWAACLTAPHGPFETKIL